MCLLKNRFFTLVFASQRCIVFYNIELTFVTILDHLPKLLLNFSYFASSCSTFGGEYPVANFRVFFVKLNLLKCYYKHLDKM